MASTKIATLEEIISVVFKANSECKFASSVEVNTVME